MARETWVQSQVKSYQRLKKLYLMPPCLTLSIIRYGSRVKWVNPVKGVTPSAIPWRSSYGKGSLRVTLDYGHQSYFSFTHIYIYIYKLDGNYTRMLRVILNKSWSQHRTKQQLYGHLPPITKNIRVR